MCDSIIREAPLHVFTARGLKHDTGRMASPLVWHRMAMTGVKHSTGKQVNQMTAIIDHSCHWQILAVGFVLFHIVLQKLEGHQVRIPKFPV